MRVSLRYAIAITAFATAAIWGGWLVARNELPFASFTDGERSLGAPRGDRLRLAAWEPPRALEGGVNGGGRVSRPAISPDGRFLVFAVGEIGLNAELYIADLDGTEPHAPRPLAELNSPFDELAPAFGSDALYFASNRTGGVGGLDLYRAPYKRGAFGAVETVGGRAADGGGVNTEADDTDPAPGPVGVLAFASNREREGLAGFHLYLATPIDPGYQVEPLTALDSAGDDREPAFFSGSRGLLFASNRGGGEGGFDLYRTVLVRDAWLPPRPLADVNSPADERGPCVANEGFALWLAVDHGDRSELARARSVELFRLPARGARWIDFAILGILLAIALLALLGQRWRRLDLLTKCLILALILHLLLLLWLRHVVPDLGGAPLPPGTGDDQFFSVRLEGPAGGAGKERGGALEGTGSGDGDVGPERFTASVAPGSPGAGDDERGAVALGAPSLPQAAAPAGAAGAVAPSGSGEASGDLAVADARVESPNDATERLAAAAPEIGVAPRGGIGGGDGRGPFGEAAPTRASTVGAGAGGAGALDGAPAARSGLALGKGPSLPGAPAARGAQAENGGTAAARGDLPVAIAGPAGEPGNPIGDGDGAARDLQVAPRGGLGTNSGGGAGAGASGSPQRASVGGAAVASAGGGSSLGEAPSGRALPAPTAPGSGGAAPSGGRATAPGAAGDASGGGNAAVALRDAEAGASGAAAGTNGGGSGAAPDLAVAPRGGLGTSAGANGGGGGSGPQRAGFGGGAPNGNGGGAADGEPGARGMGAPSLPLAGGSGPARARASASGGSGNGTGSGESVGVALRDAATGDGVAGGGETNGSGTNGNGGPGGAPELNVAPRGGLGARGESAGGGGSGPRRADLAGASGAGTGGGGAADGDPSGRAMGTPSIPLATGNGPGRGRASVPGGVGGGSGGEGGEAGAAGIAMRDTAPGGGGEGGSGGSGSPNANGELTLRPSNASGALSSGADASGPRRWSSGSGGGTGAVAMEAPERRGSYAPVAAAAKPDEPPPVVRERASAPLDDTPYRNRFGLEKVHALEQGGGGATTEAAVAAGLAYLARHQSADGSWPGDSSDSQKYADVSVGRTGLSLLAFMGAGHTHASKTEHSPVTARALAWLLKQQDPSSGHFGDSEAYSHGIATYAVAECFALTRDDRLREPLQRAVDEILHNQNRTGDSRRLGGWSYYYASDRTYDTWPRTSITSWQIMALESARLGGIKVPDDAFELARGYLKSAYDETRGAFRYSHDPSRLRSTIPNLPGSTPAALFALSLLGEDLNDPYFHDALEFTKSRAPRGYRYAGELAFVERAEGNIYFWYYASLALFRLGGPSWDAWNERLKASLVPAQSPDGSWRPLEPYAKIAGDDENERSYTTAMCVLTLEVYYRYFTPLLKVK